LLYHYRYFVPIFLEQSYQFAQRYAFDCNAFMVKAVNNDVNAIAEGEGPALILNNTINLPKIFMFGQYWKT